jgi:hypothetical protein
MSDKFQSAYPGSDRWLGGESAWVGSSPTSGARKIRKEFTATATVSAGAVTFTYPFGAFPNGIMSVVITPGDNSGSLGFFQVPLSGQSLSVLTAYPWAAASTAQVANGSTVRANIIAVGW